MLSTLLLLGLIFLIASVGLGLGLDHLFITLRVFSERHMAKTEPSPFVTLCDSPKRSVHTLLLVAENSKVRRDLHRLEGKPFVTISMRPTQQVIAQNGSSNGFIVSSTSAIGNQHPGALVRTGSGA